ncbi:MAG: hypothetical protein WCJ19_01310 [bacterium]
MNFEYYYLDVNGAKVYLNVQPVAGGMETISYYNASGTFLSQTTVSSTISTSSSSSTNKLPSTGLWDFTPIVLIIILFALGSFFYIKRFLIKK